MKNSNCFILCLFVVSLFGCALQSDVVYIDDRVNAIEKKLSKQNKASGSIEKGLRTNYARLTNQVDRLDEMIRRLEGRIEEVNFVLQRQKKSVARLKSGNETLGAAVSEIRMKIENLESFTGYSTSSPARDVSAAGTKEPDRVDETLKSEDIILYDKGKEAFNSGKLKTAKSLFGKLLKQYPGSDKADNAQFWIGESYFRRKHYKTAILEYQKVIDNYPKGNKRPGAYLKQGLAFAELGEPENSKILLNDLIKQFPDSGEARIAQKKIATMK